MNTTKAYEVRESSATYQIGIGLGATSRLSLIEILRSGFHYKTVEAVQETLQIPLSDFGKIINIAPRTLSRRKKEGKLHTDESERLYRVAVLLERATEVLENKATAVHWLKSPKKSLGGKTPLDFADTEVGIEEVKELLGRIEHGVFA
jgi:putative toxin-antitoxin system antitoxin component (TIGR02293 family)